MLIFYPDLVQTFTLLRDTCYIPCSIEVVCFKMLHFKYKKNLPDLAMLGGNIIKQTELILIRIQNFVYCAFDYSKVRILDPALRISNFEEEIPS